VTEAEVGWLGVIGLTSVITQLEMPVCLVLKNRVEPPRRQGRQGMFAGISLGELGVLAVQYFFAVMPIPTD
jgi:hypothetical protein